MRLAFAGPDPASVADDPEGLDTIQDIIAAFQALDPEIQKDVGIFSLPMASRRENALIVNALQRCSDIVVQNSLQEGFGLTVTEAMWKRSAVLASSAAGIRQQIRQDLDGHLVHDAENPEEIAAAMWRLLIDQDEREMLGRSAQQRVHDEFLVFAHVRKWMELTADQVRERWG